MSKPASLECETSNQLFFTPASLSMETTINNSRSVENNGPHRQHFRLSGLDSSNVTSGRPQRDRMTGRLVIGNLSTQQKVRSANRNDSDSIDDSISNEDTMLYVTRHNIDHVKQSKGVCREVLLGECIPCCDPEAIQKRNIGTGLGIWMLWSIIRSEVFIYGLHIFSLVVGATKAVTTYQKEAPNLELIQSVIETAATLLLVTIRMANAYAGYRAVRTTCRHEENYDPDKDINVQTLKRWLIVFMSIGTFLFTFAIFAFLWFYLRYHLGWTILTNNFIMITMFALSTLFAARVVVILTRIREDQHKVVIHEAVIFIEEANEVIKKKTSSTDDEYERTSNDDDSSNRMIFVRALRSTKLFGRPCYIEYLNMA